MEALGKVFEKAGIPSVTVMRCPICLADLKRLNSFDSDLKEDEGIFVVRGYTDADCSFQENVDKFRCLKGHTIYIPEVTP